MSSEARCGYILMFEEYAYLAVKFHPQTRARHHLTKRFTLLRHDYLVALLREGALNSALGLLLGGLLPTSKPLLPALEIEVTRTLPTTLRK